MTKKELARRVAEEHHVSQKVAHAWTNAILESLANALLDIGVDSDVTLYGFGKFEKLMTARRQGHLPNGEFVDIPPRPRIKFTPGIYLSDAIIDNINSIQFADRMEKIRALKRGEEVPGYRLNGEVLVEVPEGQEFLDETELPDAES